MHKLNFHLQILLHDQGEIPEMKDQGFAVAPGTHTLVGIKQTKVRKNLIVKVCRNFFRDLKEINFVKYCIDIFPACLESV